MIFKNSQDDIVFDDFSIPRDRTKVGIKLSGGADSAIIAYMLALYCKQERPDITIHPITGISEGKEFNKVFAEKIIKKIEELLDYKFGEHYSALVPTSSSAAYVAGQNSLVNKLYRKNIIEMHLAGITANPNPADAPELFTDLSLLPSDDRSRGEVKKPQTTGGKWFTPLINTDKRGVAEHYERLGVMETLFPETRSCESFNAEETNNFTTHCGWCWFCQERKWGFGQL